MFLTRSVPQHILLTNFFLQNMSSTVQILRISHFKVSRNKVWYNGADEAGEGTDSIIWFINVKGLHFAGRVPE